MKTKLILPVAALLLGAQVLTAQVTYRIYGTREGLVGYKTANGHIITSYDHFVALPSGTVLNSLGGRTYTVTIKNPANGKVASNVPVWDIGPWNTKDNYWHVPRAEFTSLARGLPEAQAAYQNGFNGGKDESGRTVTNPAGIDIADGTFWTDLGLSGNAWLDVTFNWESAGTSIIKDNAATGFTASANWSTGTSSTDKYSSDYRYRSTAAVSDPATWTASLPSSGTYSVYAWWPQGSNRSATAPFVVSYSGGSATKNMSEQINGGKWNLLGSWSMASGTATVKLSCWTTTGYIVVADAVKWAK